MGGDKELVYRKSVSLITDTVKTKLTKEVELRIVPHERSHGKKEGKRKQTREEVVDKGPFRQYIVGKS